MTLTDTKRIIRSGITNFTRNGIVSIASVLIVTITLSVIASLIFVQATLHNSLDQIQNKVDVTVYFTTSASEDQILPFKSSSEKLPEVASVTYTSADQALQDFRDRHQNDYLTLQALDELGDNPLGASIDIKAKDPTQYESIVKELENDTALAQGATPIVDSINYSQNKTVIDRLTAIIHGANTLGFAVTLILILISIIITFNTIRLTIYFAREEIGVMRLVGAENKYISGPFMVEGMIYGIIATIITIALFFPATIWLGRNLTDFLGINIYDYFISNFFEIFFIILVSGVILGSFSSVLAVRRYLRK